MTLELYYDLAPCIIAIFVFWVVRDASFVIWARNVKRTTEDSKLGRFIYISMWVILSVDLVFSFNPRYRWYLPWEPFEYMLTFVLFFIPILVRIFFTIIVMVYFRRNPNQFNNLSLLGPELLMTGLILTFIIYFVGTYSHDVSLYVSGSFYIGVLIGGIIQPIGILMLFLKTIRIKDKFFAIGCGLYLAYFILVLILFMMGMVAVY